jgi:hypothetical protein
MLSMKLIGAGALTPILALAGLFSSSPIGVGEPDAGTAAGWRVYIQATEQRRARELQQPDRFLAMAFTPDGAADRRSVLAGAVVIRRIETIDTQGEAVDVAGGMVHHWRGAVFVPGATVETLIAR